MANQSIDVIIEEGSVKPLAPPGTIVSQSLTAPTNEGVADVYIYTPGYGASPPAVEVVWTHGQRYAPGQQVQLQDFFGDDLGSFFATMKPQTAPDPNASIDGGLYLCDCGSGGFPTAATFTDKTATFSQPAVNSNVSLTVVDATPLAGFSAGERMYMSCGCLYELVSVSGTTGGTVVLMNLGLGAARVTETA